MARTLQEKGKRHSDKRNVPGVVSLFKEIQHQPEKISEMIRMDVREMVGKYLTEMMNAELTHFLGGEPYQRKEGEVKYRNGC